MFYPTLPCYGISRCQVLDIPACHPTYAFYVAARCFRQHPRSFWKSEVSVIQVHVYRCFSINTVYKDSRRIVMLLEFKFIFYGKTMYNVSMLLCQKEVLCKLCKFNLRSFLNKLTCKPVSKPVSTQINSKLLSMEYFQILIVSVCFHSADHKPSAPTGH